MNQTKITLTLITTLSISLLLTACGGGSSTTENAVSNLPMVKIDASNQKEVTAFSGSTFPKVESIQSYKQQTSIIHR